MKQTIFIFFLLATLIACKKDESEVLTTSLSYKYKGVTYSCNDMEVKLNTFSGTNQIVATKGTQILNLYFPSTSVGEIIIKIPNSGELIEGAANSYATSQGGTGTINITRNDTTALIGTFSFIAKHTNSANNTFAEVTEGKFTILQ